MPVWGRERWRGSWVRPQALRGAPGMGSGFPGHVLDFVFCFSFVSLKIEGIKTLFGFTVVLNSLKMFSVNFVHVRYHVIH